MKDKDLFKDVFSEKLGNFEAPVRPELWSSISSQIVTTTASSVASGMSVLSKLIIGGSISAAIVGGTILLYPSKTEVDQIVKENKSAVETPLNFTSSTTIETTSLKKTNVIKKVDFKVAPLNKIITSQFGDVFEELTPFYIPTNTLKSSIEPPLENVIEEPLVSNIIENINSKIVTPLVDEKLFVYENKSSVKLNLPNVFTPNNDGKADLFYIESNDLTNFSLVVFDSKNNVIFKSDDPSIKWDGIKLNGEMVEEGKYVYIITALDNLGQEISEYNFLTISRN